MASQKREQSKLGWIVGAIAIVLLMYLVPQALRISNPESGSMRSKIQIPSAGNVEGSVLSQPSINDPYPGGNTPAPAPTLTTIPSGQGVYNGWTGQQIANVLIQRYETSNPVRAIAPTTHVYSVLVGIADAEELGISADLVAAESQTDYAIILEGQFPTNELFPGLVKTPTPDAPYMLVVIDTDSGSVRLLRHAYDLQTLLDVLPNS